MSGQRRRRETRRAPPREGFAFDGGSVVRVGRQIFMETHFEEDAHEAFVAEALGRIPEIEAERASRLLRLRDVILEVGPAACVAAASLTYLHKDPDTYRESEDDRPAAHVEFLALQALPVLESPGRVAPEEVIPRTNEALDLVREAFRDTIDLLTLRAVAAMREPDASASYEEYRRSALTDALVVRGSAYAEHVKLILDGCFGPFDVECRTHLGFTAKEAWELTNAIGDLIGERLTPRLSDARLRYRELSKELKHARRKGTLPDSLAQLTPSGQRAALGGKIFADAFSDPLALATLTADALAGATGIEIAACEGWLDVMHCPATEFVDAHHAVPAGGHPITRRPLLKVGDGYLAPAPMSIPEALRPRMEDALRQADHGAWDRYEAHRGRWLETTSTSRLHDALPGAASWTGIDWSGRNDSSDLDGLIHCDDLALRIQCKGGRVSPAARRGAPSMVEDMTAVVSDAAHQHSRLSAALQGQTPHELGFTAEQSSALCVGLTIEVVVSLDDLTVWSTETHKLRHLVVLPETDQVPWVLSLADLMAATDILSGAQLAHFITRRQRLEREQRIEAHDELDWVGHYIRDGLYFDDIFDRPDAPDSYRLLSYTEPFDTWYFSREGLTSKPVPKPEQPLPKGLAALLRRLEHDRPRHWLIASILLLNGDHESRKLVDDFMAHTVERAAEVGWSNASQVFSEYGLTLWTDARVAGANLITLMESYADEKIAETRCPSWVALGLGGDGRLAIAMRESRPDMTLAHTLLRRSTPPTMADNMGA